MAHYICTGGCKGVSDIAKSCGDSACSNFGKPLPACECKDGSHSGAFGSELTAKKCVPCDGGVPPITRGALKPYLEAVPKWELVPPPTPPILGGEKIRRVFEFKDFAEAMIFVNKVAALAEEEGHHPDINIHWNTVTFELWTHEIGGLSENDFIVAAKIEKLGK